MANPSNDSDSRPEPNGNAVGRSGDLPFTLREIRAAVPASCFRPSTARSLRYLVTDIACIVALYVAAARIDTAWLWPVFCAAQGTLFWALFVISHDCGHGSFSRHRWLNELVGQLTNAPLLVPYHGWRVSHRIHHRHTADADLDEGWHSITVAEYRSMPWYSRVLRFHLAALVFPLYLLRGTYRRGGSHFHPRSPLFRPVDRTRVVRSSLLCLAMCVVLGGLAYRFGFAFILAYYLDVVTFLHHTDAGVPVYRGKSWSFLRGSLASVDRSYGWLERIHHHAGHHVAHHLCPDVPHYHLREATDAIKPILGSHYRESTEPIWRAFARSVRSCRVVPDDGEVLYYSAAPARPV
jgi:omega-3 fatty acid desaturase (delta-15 desaturase)